MRPRACLRIVDGADKHVVAHKGAAAQVRSPPQPTAVSKKLEGSPCEAAAVARSVPGALAAADGCCARAAVAAVCQAVKGVTADCVRAAVVAMSL